MNVNEVSKRWGSDVNITLPFADVDYILWSLYQNIEEIQESRFYDQDSEQDVEFIQSLINSIRKQAGIEEE